MRFAPRSMLALKFSAASQPYRALSSATPSVVEEMAQSRNQQFGARVPIMEGEHLLYTAGASTKRTITLSWASALVASGYFVAVKGAEAWNPALQLLNTAWTAVFAGVGISTMGLAVSTSRCCVRAAVLCSDGAHVRIYPYGAVMGIGMGKPVTVPVKLLKENAAFKAAKKDSDAVYVQVKDSKAHLIWDKPAGLPLTKGPGSGLNWTPKGVALPSSTGLTTEGLYLMTAEDRAALKNYALLCHVLNGHTVHMPTVLSGAWELERLREQLEPGKHYNPKQQRLADLTYWKPATDRATGREYWYHELTWQTVWQPPVVDGKGPREAAAALAQEAAK